MIMNWIFANCIKGKRHSLSLLRNNRDFAWNLLSSGICTLMLLQCAMLKIIINTDDLHLEFPIWLIRSSLLKVDTYAFEQTWHYFHWNSTSVAMVKMPVVLMILWRCNLWNPISQLDLRGSLTVSSDVAPYFILCCHLFDHSLMNPLRLHSRSAA